MPHRTQDGKVAAGRFGQIRIRAKPRGIFPVGWFVKGGKNLANSVSIKEKGKKKGGRSPLECFKSAKVPQEKYIFHLKKRKETTSVQIFW